MVPVLIGERDEGRDVSWPGRDSRLFLTGDESAGRYCIEDVIYAPGWESSAYHMESADEHWYVVEGEVEIRVGDLIETCAAGSFAYIPRDTTRAIANRSGAPARVFQWSTPAGYDRCVQEMAVAIKSDPRITPAALADIQSKYGIHVHGGPVDLPNDSMVNAPIETFEFESKSLEDFMALRERMSSLAMVPKLIHKKQDGMPIGVFQDTSSWCLLSGDESAGRAMVIETTLALNLLVPPHYQPTEEELFYSLSEGTWWRVGGEEARTKIGSFAFAPRYCTHQFGNPTDKRVSFLSINSPAGHERGLQKLQSVDLTLPENEGFLEAWGWYVHEDAKQAAH